jgi:hypothetical protein
MKEDKEICTRCKKEIKTHFNITRVPSKLEISLGIAREEVYHPKCFAKAFPDAQIS